MLLNFLVLGDDGVFPLHAMTFACTFTVVHPRFVACARLRKASCPDFALYVVHVRKSAVWQITRILNSNCPYFLNSLRNNDTVLSQTSVFPFCWNTEYSDMMLLIGT
jgi:hypothetical protein